MKFKNVLEFCGFRKKVRHFVYQDVPFELGDGNTIRFARWQSFSEKEKSITNQMVEAYRAYLSEGDFCIDIGAHSGDTVLPMAIAAGPTGCALALEPNPYVYHVLERNARANRHLCHIETIMAAASDKEQFLQFNYSDSSLGNGGEHKNIPKLKHGHMYQQEVFAIDLAKELKECYSNWLPRLKFIKVDTEGNDLYVLQSLRDILEQYHPAIKAEVFKHTSPEYRHNLLNYLNELGYNVRKIEVEPIIAGSELKTESMTDWPQFDLLAVA